MSPTWQSKLIYAEKRGLNEIENFGLPLLPPHYSMRLLPYIILSLETWKIRLLREKDQTDFVSVDI